MVCIYCASPTQVRNSRSQKRLGRVWRRRCCTSCRAVFTTIETVDLESSWVYHCSGTLEPFARDKLFVSLLQALGHRSDALDAASALTATVTALLRKTATHGRVERNDVVKTAHSCLERFDKAAAVHYAAYHHPSAAAVTGG